MKWALTMFLCLGCAPVSPETSCFGVGDVPESKDVVIRPATPDEDFEYRPQTEEAAVQAMWDRLHAMFRDSDDRVLCVLDEGDVTCESGVLGSESRSPGRKYWNCRWSHPESGRLPEDPQTHTFFTSDP